MMNKQLSCLYDSLENPLQRLLSIQAIHYFLDSTHQLSTRTFDKMNQQGGYDVSNLISSLSPIGQLDSLASSNQLPPLEPGTAYLLHQETRGSQQLTVYVISAGTSIDGVIAIEGAEYCITKSGSEGISEGVSGQLPIAPPQESDSARRRAAQLEALTRAGIEIRPPSEEHPGGAIVVPSGPHRQFEEFLRDSPDDAADFAASLAQESALNAIQRHRRGGGRR